MEVIGVVLIIYTHSVREINWDYIGDAVPAFLTLIIIPLTYKSAFPQRFSKPRSDGLSSIAYGVIAGICSYIVINGIPWLIMKATGNRIVPPNYENSEEWVIPPGSIFPGWM